MLCSELLGVTLLLLPTMQQSQLGASALIGACSSLLGAGPGMAWAGTSYTCRRAAAHP
jgi:hypothetical protein